MRKAVSEQSEQPRRVSYRTWRSICGVASFCLWGAVASASSESSPYLQQLIDQARATKLSESRAWRKLLLIPDRWYPSDRSLIDDPHFFLAPDGRVNPEHELTATLTAFFEPLPSKPAKDYVHPQCRYAARFSWLNDAMGIDRQRLLAVDCHDLRKFLNFLSYKGASLVFSNYYVDNPSSMFGHSFLRLHRDKTTQNDTGLLDDTINFSAFVPDVGSWLYPIKGLAGGYPGRFALLPYYRKIQEYNNYESRDLWEYELNLTTEDVHRLELVLWELGGTYIDYYYLDDNCSYVMLALLEAAKPELQLTGELWVYAVPADTLRAVTRAPNLVRGVNYRPSALSRFISRYAALEPSDEVRVKRLVATPNHPAAEVFRDCDPKCQARTIDAAIEFIDFKEKLAGSRLPETYGELRAELLIRRAQVGVKMDPLNIQPTSSAPELGHDAGLVALGAGVGAGNIRFSELHWRPALHELSANDEGYSDSLAIGFLDTVIRTESGHSRPFLKNLHPIEITSLPNQAPLIQSFAWHIDVGYERGFGFDEAINLGRQYFQAGIGQSIFLLQKRGLVFVLAQGDIGHAAQFGWHIGPVITMGALAKISDEVKLVARSNFARHYGEHAFIDSVRHSLALSIFINQKFEVRITAASDQGQRETMAALHWYF